MRVLYFTLSLLFIIACSSSGPTVVEEQKPTTPTKPEAPVSDKPLSPCTKFSDVTNGEELLEAYVLARDFIKAKDYDMAFPYWEKVYRGAPAADGQRNTVFVDGITLYEQKLAQATDESERNAIVDRIFEIYDEMDKCYGQDGYVPGKKAFDLYYKYPERATKDEIYSLFKSSLVKDGEDAYFFIINPFTATVIDQLNEEKITLEQAQEDVAMINAAINKGKSSGKNTAQWSIVDEYTSSRFEGLEGVEGFYDCEYYKSKYYIEFQDNPTDCENIETIYARLRWGKCPIEDAMVQELATAKTQHCKKEVVNDPSPKCRDFLSEGKYRDAISCYEEKMNASTDSERKASYALIISKIYYAHLRNFPQSRAYALQAAAFKPNWGEPYILIGKLYASSGPLCGPGRGFDSQRVTWPAIDMWNKAKRIDSSVAGEANKNINRYTQYMPTREDIFLRGLKAGDPYRVPCWIQENTTVRTVD